jgi:hypothetical protein
VALTRALPWPCPHPGPVFLPNFKRPIAAVNAEVELGLLHMCTPVQMGSGCRYCCSMTNTAGPYTLTYSLQVSAESFRLSHRLCERVSNERNNRMDAALFYT